MSCWVKAGFVGYGRFPEGMEAGLAEVLSIQATPPPRPTPALAVCCQVSRTLIRNATQNRGDVKFTDERDSDQFHSPKNLAMAVTSEAGELAEVFQWMSEQQSRDLDPSGPDLARVREEIADVMICLLRLTDVLKIDLSEAVTAKIDLNCTKYPVDISRGNATKYNWR